MKNNPVVWFEIYVRDMPRARAFYEAVFGIKLEKLQTPEEGPTEMWAFPIQQNGAGATGALAKMPDGPCGEGNSTIVYFSSEDCAIEATRVVPNGGRVMKEKFAIGEYGFIALVIDTEGNVIGIHSNQ